MNESRHPAETGRTTAISEPVSDDAESPLQGVPTAALSNLQIPGRAARTARTRYSTRELLISLLIMLVLAIGGSALLWWGVTASGLLRGLAGALLIAYGLMHFGAASEMWLEDDTRTGRKWIWVCVVLVVGVALVVVANLLYPGRSELAIVLAAVGLLILGCLIGPIRVGVGWLRRWPTLMLAAGAAVSLVSLVLLVTTSWSDVALVATSIGGLSLYAVGLEGLVNPERVDEPGSADDPGSAGDGRRVSADHVRRVSAACIVGAVVLTVVALNVDRTLLALVSGWFAVAASMAFGEAYRPGTITWTTWVAFATGLVCMMIGAVLLDGTRVTLSSGFALVFAVVVLAGIGASLVIRGELVLLGGLAAVAMVFSLVTYTSSDTDGVNEVSDGPTRGIVAIGDSFISGEGAASFFEETNQVGTSANQCRRAPTAYPVLLSRAGAGEPGDPAALDAIAGLDDTGLTFYACSGADIDNVIHVECDPAVEKGGCEPDCVEDPDDGWGQYPCSPPSVWGADLQLRNASADTTATELVLISVGGNDAGFGDAVKACLLPGSCNDELPFFVDAARSIEGALVEVYGQTARAFPAAQIVVMPYPLVTSLGAIDACAAGIPFDDDEHRFIHDFTIELNRVLHDAVEEAQAAGARIRFFDQGADAFQGHHVCDDESAVNLIVLRARQAPLPDRLNPLDWTHNSMHPNALGHQLTAQRLVRWLNEEALLVPAEGQVDTTGSTDAASDQSVDEVVPLRTVYEERSCGSIEKCEERRQDWTGEQVDRAVGALRAPFLLLLVGGWLVALGMVRLWPSMRPRLR